VKGEPLRFALGHANRTKRRPPIGPDDFRVEDRGFESPCWVRVGKLNNKGYGTISIAGRLQYAHRAMYEQEVGPIPEGMQIDHLCRQRDCLRPTHLEIVTQAKNLQRGKGAKLTESDVFCIRVAPTSVTTRALAVEYGISESHMSRVRRGVKWK
jgi:hypothetical protein